MRHAPKYKRTIDYLRERFCQEITRIPIANRSYRLAEYQRILNHAKKDKDIESQVKALRNSELDIGDHLDKLSDAIAKSHKGDIIVNNWVITAGDEEIAHVARERSAILERAGRFSDN
jgi:hypothetical protein